MFKQLLILLFSSGLVLAQQQTIQRAGSVSSSSITNALGYTPAPLANPTFTGTATIPTASIATATVGALTVTNAFSAQELDILDLFVTNSVTMKGQTNYGAIYFATNSVFDIGSSSYKPATIYANAVTPSASVVLQNANGFFGLLNQFALSSPAANIVTIKQYTGTNFLGIRIGGDATNAPTVYIRPGDATASDRNGGELDLESGITTGTATNGGFGGVKILTSLQAESSGSTVGTLSPRFWAPGKFVTLTHATATTIETFSLPANKIIGGNMFVTVYATNSTPHAQTISSTLKFSAVAIGSTITGTLSTPDNTPQAADNGTLTLTGYTLVDNGNNTFSIKVNVSSDLSSPTERALVLVTGLNSSAAVTITDP